MRRASANEPQRGRGEMEGRDERATEGGKSTPVAMSAPL
jgi:hypothetical protein